VLSNLRLEMQERFFGILTFYKILMMMTIITQ
jgi:hypothetical protein